MQLRKVIKWTIIICACGAVVFFAYFCSSLATGPVHKDNIIEQASDKHQISPMTQVGKHFDSVIKQNKFSGTILVVKDGQPILNQGYGKTKLYTSQNNTTGTHYPIASLTKNVTAVITIKQLETHGYDANTKLSTFYPDLPNANHITIRQLITMNAKYETNKFTPQHLGDEVAYIDEIVKHTYYDNTKTTWHYNPTDYHILVGILQKLTHKTYEQLVRENFGKKYELATLNAYEHDQNKPLGSTIQGMNVTFHKAAYQKELGTGDVFTNTWGIYKMLEDEINNKLVSPEQFKAIATPMVNFHEIYSGGLYSEDNNRAYFCRGVMQGFEDYVYMSKDGRDAVILQSNQYSVTGKNSNLAKYLYGEVVGHHVVFKNY